MNSIRFPFYLFSFYLLFSVSCSSTRNAPYWVNNVPTDSTSYLGVGMVVKEGNPDYVNKAKEMALGELTNSIQVNVSVESVLNQSDINKVFSESFSSTTKLNSNNFLYEIEKSDVWENKKNYWVLYKINKAEYEKIRKKKISDALNQSYSLYKDALKFETDKDHLSSIMKLLQSFEIISPFLNEPLLINDSNGKPLSVGKEVYAKIFSFYKECEIQYSLPKINSTQEPFGDYLTLKINFKNSPLSNFPITISSSSTTSFAGKYNTDKNGELKILVPFTERTASDPVTVSISADMSKLTTEVLKAGIGQDLLSTLSTNQESFPLGFSKATNITSDSQEKDYWNHDDSSQNKDILKNDNDNQNQIKNDWSFEKDEFKFDDPFTKDKPANLSYDSHEKLMEYLKQNSKMESKLIDALTDCKINYDLSVTQVVEIVRLFKIDNYKWEAVEYLLAGISNKKDFKDALKSEFTFDDYKEKLEKL